MGRRPHYIGRRISTSSPEYIGQLGDALRLARPENMALLLPAEFDIENAHGLTCISLGSPSLHWSHFLVIVPNLKYSSL